MGWWHTATREQRLAQIDGAIELGMTAYQCAMNCGAVYEDKTTVSDRSNAVAVFAANHGRHFGYSDEKEAVRADKIAAFHARRKSFAKAKDAYLAGEPVNFWGAE